jgi:diacylglycerol kinase family enzyme
MSSRPLIGVISNANSRRNRRDPRLAARLAEIAGPNAIVRATRTRDDLARAVVEFRDAGVGVIAINGGDGTNHVTLTEMIARWGQAPLPQVAILRGGTMNTVSNSFHIRGTPEKILRWVVSSLGASERLPGVPRRILRITATDAVRYGFIFGNGIVYNFLEEYYRPAEPTPVVAATTLARAVGSVVTQGALSKRLFRRLDARASVDGRPWVDGPFIGVLASSTEQIGLGFRPWHRCTEDLDGFHTIAVRGDLPGIVRELGNIRFGKPVRNPDWADAVCRTLRIDAPDLLEYVIDGDLYQTHESVTVEAGPMLHLAVPER